MSQREHEAAEKHTASATPQHLEPAQPARNALLRLQSAAGNRAVTRSIVVQRNTYLDQLPPELLHELGTFTAQSPTHDLAEAAGTPGRRDAVTQGRVVPFVQYVEQLRKVKADLDAKRAAVRAGKEEGDRVQVTSELEAWAKSWAVNRAKVEQALWRVVTREAEQSSYWAPAMELIGSLPKSANSATKYLTKRRLG